MMQRNIRVATTGNEMSNELRLQLDDQERARALATHINSMPEAGAMRARADGDTLTVAMPAPLILDLVSGLLGLSRWIGRLFRDTGGSDEANGLGASRS